MKRAHSSENNQENDSSSESNLELIHSESNLLKKRKNEEEIISTDTKGEHVSQSKVTIESCNVQSADKNIIESISEDGNSFEKNCLANFFLCI